MRDILLQVTLVVCPSLSGFLVGIVKSNEKIKGYDRVTLKQIPIENREPH